MKLVVENLSAQRTGQLIFANIHFTLEDGKALVVTGSNGSGKSTLLRVICGLLDASTGSVTLAGCATNDESSVPHEQMHYLGHQNALKLALSVEENLAFWQNFCGNPLLDIKVALAAVGLPDIGHLPAAYLSAGQKRRIAIARLLVSHKPIWIVDEPTSALDKASETLFANLIKDHLGEGGMVIAATHQSLGIDSQSLNLDDTRPELEKQVVN